MILRITSLFLLAIILTGCGQRQENHGSQYYQLNYVSDLCVKKTSADRILLNISSQRILASRPRQRGIDQNLLFRDTDSAFCKRMAATELALYLFDYKFLNYAPDGKLSCNFLLAMRLDAISNLKYNLLSLVNIPRRIIILPRVSVSFVDWIGNLITVVIDLLLALIMLFIGPVIGFICHPLESLANFTIGLLYIPDYGIEQYLAYIKQVNLISSVWYTLKAIFVIIMRTVLFWIF